MGQRGRVGDVVDGHEVELGPLLPRRPEEVASDPSEPIDADLDRHLRLLVRAGEQRKRHAPRTAILPSEHETRLRRSGQRRTFAPWSCSTSRYELHRLRQRSQDAGGREPERRGPMATFVILGNFTDQGIRAFKDSPKRADAFGELLQRHGASLTGIYWTVGQYDLVVIAEAPDAAVATAALLDVGALGHV